MRKQVLLISHTAGLAIMVVVLSGLSTPARTFITASARLQGQQPKGQEPPTPPPALPPPPDARTTLYSQWLEHSLGGAEQQKVAYLMAKEFVSKFATPEDESLQTIRKWLVKYEKDTLESDFNQAVNAKDVGKTFEAGRKILKEEPENFRVLSTLVISAATVGKYADANLNREAADYAAKALKLIETGKLTNLVSFQSEEAANGFLNYALGRFLADTSPAEAVVALRKVASSKTTYSQEPSTYLTLARALNVSEYSPLQAEYAKKHEGQPKTPEGDAMLTRLYQAADRLIDAYARTVALLTKPGQESAKAQLMTPLTDLYKSRNNNSDAGLNDLIANVLSKPLP